MKYIFFILLLSNYVFAISPKTFDKPCLVIQYDDDKKGCDFYKISDVAIDKKGNIFILDKGNSRIQTFDSNGNYLYTIGSIGKGPSNFYNPDAMIFDNNRLIVLDSQNNCIKIIGQGNKVQKIVKENGMFFPSSICKVGESYVVSSGNAAVERKTLFMFDSNFKLIKNIACGIAIDNIDKLVLTLWNKMSLFSSSDYSNFYVVFKFYPIIKNYDKFGILKQKFDMQNYYGYYKDKKRDFPTGYTITAFSPAPNNTFLIVKCNNEKKQCGEILCFNNDFSKLLFSKKSGKHFWKIRYFKNFNKFALITSEDEVLFYEAFK